MTPEQRKHFEYVRDVRHGDAEPEWYHVIDVHGCNRFYHKTEDCPYGFKTPLYTHPPAFTAQPKEPEQEPIAKVCHDIEQHIGWNPNLNVAELPEGMPLYGSPQRKPLTYCPEWMTEEEQTAYTFGWFKALESQRIAQPEQRKPLLASDIVTMYDESPRSDSEMIAFARAIEAAHGIKGDA